MNKQKEAQTLVIITLLINVLALVYYAVEDGLIHLDDYMLTAVEIITASLIGAVIIALGYGIYRDHHDPAYDTHSEIMNMMYGWREIPNSIWDQAVTRIESDGVRYYAWRDGWNVTRVMRENEIRKELR